MRARPSRSRSGRDRVHNGRNVDRSRIATKPESTTHAGTGIQVLGLIVLSVGAGLIFIPAGIVIFGAGLIFAGTTMELG